MSLKDRVENGLTGYVLLDLWKIMADKITTKRKLPKGALSIAPQTQQNLQSVVLGMLSYALGKDAASPNPFSKGHCRMTELPVEEWFGRLRMRSVTAQLTTTAFWRAAAKEMIRASKNKKGEMKAVPCDSEPLPPLTEGEFFDCSKRALESAVRLAAWCGGFDTDSLKAVYFAQCQQTHTYVAEAADQDMHEWERDEQELWDEDREKNEAKELLSQVQQEARDEQEDDEEDEEPADDNEKRNEMFDLEVLRSLPDGEELAEICATSKDCMSPFKDDSKGNGGGQPQERDDVCTTLSQALGAVAFLGDITEQSEHQASRNEQAFDRLWRLCMYLRHWRGGGDSHFIKNARSCRKVAATTSWYKCFGQIFYLFNLVHMCSVCKFKCFKSVQLFKFVKQFLYSFDFLFSLIIWTSMDKSLQFTAYCCMKLYESVQCIMFSYVILT